MYAKVIFLNQIIKIIGCFLAFKKKFHQNIGDKSSNFTNFAAILYLFTLANKITTTIACIFRHRTTAGDFM